MNQLKTNLLILSLITVSACGSNDPSADTSNSVTKDGQTLCSSDVVCDYNNMARANLRLKEDIDSGYNRTHTEWFYKDLKEADQACQLFFKRHSTIECLAKDSKTDENLMIPGQKNRELCESIRKAVDSVSTTTKNRVSDFSETDPYAFL